MSSDTKRLDNEREAARKRFEEQEDKTVPYVTESVLTGDGSAALDSCIAEVKRLHAAGKASIVIIGAIAAPEPTENDGEEASDGYLEVIADRLAPRDLLLFTSSNLPARFADHIYTVLKRALEAQILHMTTGATPEKGN